MQQARQEGFLRVCIVHTDCNFTGESGASMGMLPESVKPEVMPVLTGMGGLLRGGTQGHVANRRQIDPGQDGLHMLGVDRVAAFSGFKPIETDAESRIHLDGAVQ